MVAQVPKVMLAEPVEQVEDLVELLVQMVVMQEPMEENPERR